MMISSAELNYYQLYYNKIMFKEHGVCPMLSLTLFKILDCYSPFCLKFRCRSIGHGHMPIGVPLEPSLYIFSRFRDIRPPKPVRAHTRRKWPMMH